MEYLLANFPIKKGTKYEDVYFEGPFEIGSDLRIVDGEIMNYTPQQIETMSVEDILSTDLRGLYTFICYNSKNKQIIIKNDILGEIPTYFYIHDKKILVSNNAWKILFNLLENEIKIDKDQLNSYLYYTVQPQAKSTFILNLNILSNASILTFNIDDGSITENQYWEFEMVPKRELSLEDAMNEFDKALDDLFDYVIRKNPGKILGFGNSGGLDSRLVGIYARERNFLVKGITIADIRPRKLIKSNSAYQASKIAKKCGIDNFLINYTAEDYDSRNLLDIRNNFFGASQIFKNPFEKIPDFDIMLTGHEGLLIGSGYGPSVIDIDQSMLADALIARYKNVDATQITKTSLWEKIKKIFQILAGKQQKRFDEFSSENIARNIESKQNIFDEYFSTNEIEQIHKEMKTFVEKYKNKYSVVNIWRVFFLKQAMRLNYLGGFESLNRLKKTYYLYYPFAFSYIETWPREFLDDRMLLKKFLKQKAPDIGKIPGQDMEPIELSGEKDKNLFRKYLRRIKQVYKKIVLKIRKKGLEYSDWLKDPKYQEYAQSVINRPNPFFADYIDVEKLKKLNLFNYKSLVNLVKLKRIFDIIHFKEQHLLDREDFELK